jgi:hypothetical protein
MTFHYPRTLSCNTCPEAIDTEADNGRAWDAFMFAKRSGWRQYKDAYDDWAHSCPDCAAEWDANKRRKR